jgi:hypothetical protein
VNASDDSPTARQQGPLPPTAGALVRPWAMALGTPLGAYAAVAARCGRRGWWYGTVATLAADLRKPQRTVQRYLSELRRADAVETARRIVPPYGDGDPLYRYATTGPGVWSAAWPTAEEARCARVVAGPGRVIAAGQGQPTPHLAPDPTPHLAPDPTPHLAPLSLGIPIPGVPIPGERSGAPPAAPTPATDLAELLPEHHAAINRLLRTRPWPNAESDAWLCANTAADLWVDEYGSTDLHDLASALEHVQGTLHNAQQASYVGHAMSRYLATGNGYEATRFHEDHVVPALTALFTPEEEAHA